MSINIITLGCSKNTVDTEHLSTQLAGANLQVEYDKYDFNSETVIINTCGFINDAKEESINTILDFAKAKEDGKINKLYVMGCLSQRYKQNLEDEIKEVDEYFGVDDIEKILTRFKADYKQNLLAKRKISGEKHYAYLKISEGCNRKCSFCAIPLIRGKHNSTDIPQLVMEAKGLIAQGAKEIMLIAQDLSYYGLDNYKKSKLAHLLDELAKLPNLPRIRLHYAYPALLPVDVIDAMKKHKNICNYIDIPFQHVSDKMLKIMRRGYDKAKTLEIIKQFREKIPDIAIRTTLLVGHPGETKQDFLELVDFVKEQKFDRLGVFTYSHEEDTYAGETMQDTIPEAEKQRRADELMSIQHDISLELNTNKIGQIYEVMIDRKDADTYIGRTEYDSPEVDNEVIIKATKSANPGDFFNVKITHADAYELYGEFV